MGDRSRRRSCSVRVRRSHQDGRSSSGRLPSPPRSPPTALVTARSDRCVDPTGTPTTRRGHRGPVGTVDLSGGRLPEIARLRCRFRSHRRRARYCDRRPPEVKVLNLDPVEVADEEIARMVAERIRTPGPAASVEVTTRRSTRRGPRRSRDTARLTHPPTVDDDRHIRAARQAMTPARMRRVSGAKP